MKIFYFLILLISLSTPLFSQNPVWALQIGGVEHEIGQSINRDNWGNIYVVGTFSGLSDFDPSSSVFNLTSSGGRDIFILKLNSSGDFIWAKKIGGPGDDFSFSSSLDRNGNLYIVGGFSLTVDFDPNFGQVPQTSLGNHDVFTLKLYADGQFSWVRTSSGTLDGLGFSLDVDNRGFLYQAGNFAGTFDFDPTSGTNFLTALGKSDIFISKLDTAGNYYWTEQFAGPLDGVASAVKSTGNKIFCTGSFEGTFDFDPGSGFQNFTSPDRQDAFILSLEDSGNLIWAKQLGGMANVIGQDLALDASKNVLFLGHFTDNADFDPGLNTMNLTAVGSYDIVIGKLDSLGNLIWAAQMGGSGFELSNSLKIGPTGEIFISGAFEKSFNISTPLGLISLSSQGLRDGFLTKLDSLGKFVWAHSLGSTGYDHVTGFTISDEGDIFCTGDFANIASFDSTGSLTLSSFGKSDVFVFNLKESLPMELSGISPMSKKIQYYPNPTVSGVTIDLLTFYKSVAIHLFDNVGRCIRTSHIQNAQLIDVELNGPKGLYYIKVENNQEDLCTIQVIKH